MASELLIPASIRDVRAPGFAACIDRLGEIDFSPLMVSLVDVVAASALPHIAEQFNIYGHSAWRLAATEEDKRSLIKKSIELHRFKGTPWAVKEAILSLGFAEVDLIEKTPAWNDYHVYVRGRTVTTADLALIKDVIEEFAPARSRLHTFGYGRMEYWEDDGYWGDDTYWGGFEPFVIS